MADMNLDVANKSTVEEKMMFYQSVIDNNLALFTSYIYGNEKRPPFDIFEEVSAPGNKWTVFHYAMHYGKWEIIKFIFDYLIEKNLLDKALKMKSDDNRCPMLCLLKSNALKPNEKKEIYFKILETYQIQVSDEVFQVAINRHFYDKDPHPLLKNELNIEQKMELYNSAINGDLELFKSFINYMNIKNYNLHKISLYILVF